MHWPERMPSVDHEVPLWLFRECPELVAMLLQEAFGVDIGARVAGC